MCYTFISVSYQGDIHKTNRERERCTMRVRMAEEKDIERIHSLLAQVALVHHKGRPDLFKYLTGFWIILLRSTEPGKII